MISCKQSTQTVILLERENSNGNQRNPVRYAIVDSLDCTLNLTESAFSGQWLLCAKDESQ